MLTLILLILLCSSVAAEQCGLRGDCEHVMNHEGKHFCKCGRSDEGTCDIDCGPYDESSCRCPYYPRTIQNE